MRTLALAAALASAVLATPASAAAEPMQGGCQVVVSSVTGPALTVTLVAYATASQPGYEVGVACWIADGGFGYANANNPGIAVVATGTGTAFGPFRLCQQRWGRFLDATSYTSPITCA